jgi:hypothetical protein
VAGLGDADPFSGFGFLTQKITEEKDQENNVWSYFPLEFLGLTYFKHTAMETLPDFKPPPPPAEGQPTQNVRTVFVDKAINSEQKRQRKRR